MNFIEELVSPTYNWDRKRGYTTEKAGIHCRGMIAIIISGLILDSYGICAWFSKKGIYFNGRFIFDKVYDTAVLIVLTYVITIFITSVKNWEETYKINDSDNGFPIGFVILGAFEFIFFGVIANKLFFS